MVVCTRERAKREYEVKKGEMDDDERGRKRRGTLF
jgi:hypothetical protein